MARRRPAAAGDRVGQCLSTGKSVLLAALARSEAVAWQGAHRDGALRTAPARSAVRDAGASAAQAGAPAAGPG
ncbi:hypothetical protein LP419_03540 [Massilia sp. H-1]|nr:hypothetical protein LP419_03540 [Massilia sp. H-1]